jgi:hypothetical protein
MTEQKRRQGQKGATPKQICPKCGEYLKRNYIREVVDGKQRFIKSGWTCPNIKCDYITKNLVELEKGAEQGDELQKRTAEFIFLHEQLNELAEQINALEKEAHGGQPNHMRREGPEG